MKHPLLNPDSKHYQMVDGVEAITRLEEMYPPEELATWSKITAMKYRLRIGNKDEANKEADKIKTYESYYKYLTDERSKPKGKFVEESKFKELSAHVFNCFCKPCMELNSINNSLMDAKRHYQQDVKNETTTTSKERNEKAFKKAIEILFSHPIRSAKVRKDSELPKSSKTSKPNVGGHTKVCNIRYITGSLLDELIRESNGDKLSSSEEPFKITEVQSDCDRRGSPMDRRLSEDVSAMERFERAYAKYARGLQLGNINPRDFRELISNAFTEFMESVGQVSDGQAGLEIQ